MKRASLLSAVAAQAKPEPQGSRAADATTDEVASQPTEKRASRAGPRAGHKHFGAYLDTAMTEKVAILRARLGLDNSQLVELAISELYDSKRAEGAFRR